MLHAGGMASECETDASLLPLAAQSFCAGTTPFVRLKVHLQHVLFLKLAHARTHKPVTGY